MSWDQEETGYTSSDEEEERGKMKEDYQTRTALSPVDTDTYVDSSLIPTLHYHPGDY